MKILVISPGNLPVPPSKGGSVETVIDEIFHRVGQFEDIFILAAANPRHDQKRNYQLIGIPYKNQKNYLENGLNQIKAEAFDLIQIENRPAYVPKVRKIFPNTPIVLSLHSLTFMDKIMVEEANDILSKVDGVLTVSNFITNTMKERYPKHAHLFHTNHLGVDDDKFKPISAQERTLLRRKWKINNRKRGINILFIGRIVPQKGLHTLVSAVYLLKSRYPNIQIIVVGASWPGKKKDTNYVYQTRMLTKRLKIPTIFTGYVPPHMVNQAFQLGDVFVCPTQFEEGFPLVNLEAMASGIPVITSNRGGIQEAIEHKRTGWLISEYKSPKAYANAIEYLIKNNKLKNKLIENARAHVINSFSWDHTAKAVLEYYSQFKKN